MPNTSKQYKVIADPLKGLDEIKLDIAFDVSTSTTGYAALINGKPFELPSGKYSVGQIEMVEVEQYEGQKSFTDHTPVMKERPKEYDNYGDKMFHGSYVPIRDLAVMIYQCISPINAYIGELKQKNIAAEKSKQSIRHKLPSVKVNLVFEVSEIPNAKFRNGGQTITGVRKLALYVGAVEYAISNVLHNAGFHFLQEITCKMIKPTEWQERLWKKAEATVLDTNKEKGSKLMSVKFANAKLKEWGLNEIPYEFNDMADAINIATLANEVRDNVFASAMATKRSKDVNITYNRDIAKLTTQINLYNGKAFKAKDEFIANVLWTLSVDKDVLQGAEKAKFTRYEKYDLDDIRLREPRTFLTPQEQRDLEMWETKKQDIEARLKSLRNDKVIKNEN